ncbi:hypothetical protein Tco_1386327 [Tanacetum coccineum]
MTTLKFADTHNMVAFLSKPIESEGFEQIATVKTKTINEELQLQALVDAEGVDCLPNATIFEQLTLMGAKTTTWNKFSSTMASTIICLATNQKFNFSKYIFESMVKNLDNAGNFFMYPRPKKKDTQVPQSSVHSDNVADEAVYKELDDSLERAATTTTSLDEKHDRGNINKTQSKATPNEAGSLGTTLGGGPRCQETMGDTIAQTRFENVSKLSNDPLLARAIKITSLKRRVKKLERRNKSRTYGLKILYKVGSSRRVESSDEEGLGEEDASKHGRISDIDDDVGITLVSTHFDADTYMFGVHDLDGDEVVVESEARAGEKRNVDEVVTVIDTASTILVSAATTITAVRIRPRAKGLVIHEQEQAPTPILAKRLQDEEQEQFTDAEKAILFVQFLDQRRKHFAAKKAEEKRGRPLRRAQKRSIMCTYLKNIEGWKPKDLKNNLKKSKSEIAQESSSKREGDELEQENAKKQKVDEDKEIAELQSLIEVVLDEEEVAIDDVPLATKPPTIVDWKIHKEGKKSYYQIIRADGSSKR